ncbi:hypothetical protein [Streptomyces sp. CBMA123]|uniref:hypothetical protein n=1 Tax=Streptomyces sp. CBMA123 TaxID=1896313 RepID=UPI001D7DA6AF|nr:hypothetical protein [Streptomyces sp. CBMA123]MBD0695052.1 hypothetical protein [Streptomyces sp. CBMA123]
MHTSKWRAVVAPPDRPEQAVLGQQLQGGGDARYGVVVLAPAVPVVVVPRAGPPGTAPGIARQVATACCRLANATGPARPWHR